ncbi:MAG: ABC transporter substrate-binding protein [Methanospirillaceae archaeon]|nr:ABC transporter substrate-binding protein [Methanospirillaceae archaeon]
MKISSKRDMRPVNSRKSNWKRGKHYPDISPFTTIPMSHNLALVLGFVVICLYISPVLAQNNTPLYCGVILPLSGDLGTSGQEFLSGIELAAGEINTHRESEYHVQLEVRDDAGDAGTALSHFKEMQASGIPVVIGSFTTAVTLNMAKDSEQSESTVLIAPHANGMALYGISSRFYQVNTPVINLGRFVSEWVSYTAERVAILYIDNEYGRSLVDGMVSDLAKGTVQVTGTEPIPDDADIDKLVQETLDGGPDTVVVAVYDSRLEEILTSLADAGYRGQVVLTEAGGMRNLASNITDSLSQFSICTISASTSLVQGAHTNRFVTAYREKYGRDPSEGYAGYGYDSMMIVYHAVLQGPANGTISGYSIRDGLDTIQYYGVTGPKVFDEKNAVGPAMDRWVFKDGKFELMSTSVL